jgi:hypothetical protein
MLTKILTFIAGLGSCVAAVFIMLFKMAKAQEEQTSKDLHALQKEADALKAAELAEMEMKKENEKLKEEAHSGNNLDNFDACNDLLSK